MDTTDLRLIQQLTPAHPELQRLMDEHRVLETRLTSLGKHPYLTQKEVIEQRTLKKRKLAGRDRIERILAGHR